jgi:hypothetical protein
MSCDTRKLLHSKAQSAAHHLERRLESSDNADLNCELGEMKRMAQDLLDALNELWDHEDKHGCNL